MNQSHIPSWMKLLTNRLLIHVPNNPKFLCAQSYVTILTRTYYKKGKKIWTVCPDFRAA
jgi:hypothetical protein